MWSPEIEPVAIKFPLIATLFSTTPNSLTGVPSWAFFTTSNLSAITITEDSALRLSAVAPNAIPAIALRPPAMVSVLMVWVADNLPSTLATALLTWVILDEFDPTEALTVSMRELNAESAFAKVS
ncbi:hypothetical protein HIPEINDE_02876 [Mannheimia haemolytica]